MAQRFSITLTQLSYFAECARTLNMTAASQELHVAQSAISTAISHLERALGTPMFIRQHSKGLILTPAGETLLRDTQRLFAMLGDTIDAVKASQSEVSGNIVISCFSTFSPFLLPQLIGRLGDRHPDLEVEVIEGTTLECLSALRTGRSELAFHYRFARGAEFQSDRLGRVRPHVIVPAEHRLADAGEVAFESLADEPLVLLDLPDSDDYFLDLLIRAGISPQLKYRTASFEGVRSMVSAGLGYSILNQRPQIDQTYSGGRIATLEITDPVEGLEIVASSLAQVRRSARADAVVEMAREIVLEQHPENGNGM
ncbi:LysR family transcriptional regulator [Leucobacter sp. CSA2]|uniref:LysR family transcriptional regulator n=1 Tax=Leucobacter edaphi TaxID=2796472 RepID=A0A934UX87_9MICO|nr:LysR family transcriptional regulator [Leucobacter edaphi]MBK0421760.1 LysR family transcriptional regulator [Leucobacter edaphi]